MEQPIKKNKFSYFARSRLRLRPQEIWERDYLQALFRAFITCSFTVLLVNLQTIGRGPEVAVLAGI